MQSTENVHRPPGADVSQHVARERSSGMRLLVVTPIFPNRLEPLNGPYNRQQLAALARRGRVEVRVLCAVPHVPFASRLRLPERAARLSALGESDVLDGLPTRYLRRLYVPAIGAPVAVPLYLTSLLPHRALARWADVVLGTWAYPDGCAAVLMARTLGKPCVVKVHGSDVNVLAKQPVIRAVMRRVLPLADAVVTVSQRMGEELASIGVPERRIHLVRNGVDTELFGARLTRAKSRLELGLRATGRVLLFVGRIEPQKGVPELLIAFDAVARAHPDVSLVLVGDGVLRAQTEAASRARFGGRLIVAGARPFAEIPRWMAAADVVTLPSHAEGTPNVLLEALACGRPAVATSVGGIPDILSDPRAGLLVPPRDARALGDALIAALARTWDEGDVRACGPASWSSSAASLEAVLESARGHSPR